MARENDNNYGVIYTQSAIGFEEIPFDLILSETHGVENRVTEYPVENGADINDHIIEMPESVSVRGFITGAPLTSFINDLSKAEEQGSGSDFQNRLPDALVKLLELAKGKKQPDGSVKRQPVRFYTVLRVYDNMIIESISIPKSDSVDALIFDMKLKKLNIVNSELVTGATVSSAGAAGGAADGVEDQAPDEINAGRKDDNKTELYKLTEKGYDAIKSIVPGAK